MLQAQQIDELVCVVSALDREALVQQFSCYRANFPLDFTQEFLTSTPLERLKHIFLAICLQSQRMPEFDQQAPRAA